MEILTNIAMKELKGRKDTTLSRIPSGCCIPTVEAKNTPINNMVIGVELELTSSVLETRAPKAPYMKE